MPGWSTLNNEMELARSQTSQSAHFRGRSNPGFTAARRFGFPLIQQYTSGGENPGKQEPPMTVQTITLNVPETLYKQLEAQARAAARSLEEVATQTLARNLPPPVEDDLSPAMRAELNAMKRLSDESLWQIAESTVNPDKVALYDVLLERLHADALTPEGQEWLDRLREEADALMLRKAHAYALLQSRGRKLPSLEALHAQTR